MKKVLLLVCKCILVTAPLWLFPVYCAYNLLYVVGADYVGALWNKEFTQTTQDKYYSTLILGDSTANAAYVPEVLSDATVNLALAGSSTIEGYYTLEDYLEYNEAPKDVFISYMDYHLEEDEFTWDVCNFIHKFSEEQNAEIYKAIKKYGEQSVEELTSSDYERDEFMYSIYSPTVYSYSVWKSLGSDRKANNIDKMNSTIIRNGRYCSITNTEYEPDDIYGYSKFIVGDLQEYYYKRILKLCEKNDINVHMIKLPLCIDAGFVDDYEDEVQDYYDELLEDYEDADFYWFHTTYEHEFFCDQYHMNNHGAFRFSRELKEMYPEAFEDYDDISEERMLALNEDIIGENYMGELSKWIDGKPYTLLIVDSTGVLGEIYYMYVGYNGHDVQLYETDAHTCEYPIWYVSGDDTSISDKVQLTVGDSIVLNVNEEDAAIIPCEELGISFAVIDNTNNKIICTRECIFTDKGFREIYEK